MRVRVNGKDRDFPSTVRTVEDLVAHLGLADRIVVVEKNREIVDGNRREEAFLADGDRVEIVQFVGGG
ncbi:sulfur carrier protein [Melghirimyces profundicolus]|uniref:Sulfur carrier protein n=1 Tax=Melghirimyces profundicolus TaxID=1242148 RepID=A0A2T6C9G1_9BACL|nr:sulfur carrier protein ThiS [Melghirimyces profundicolus]PTX64923.1 sulfur carrier protein [Melghirimyces profundicolus]